MEGKFLSPVETFFAFLQSSVIKESDNDPTHILEWLSAVRS